MIIASLSAWTVLLILLINFKAIVDASEHRDEKIPITIEIDPPIQAIATKLFEGCFNRKEAIIEDALTLFTNRLSNRQIKHAIYLIISKATIDADGKSDPETLKLLRVLVRKLNEANRTLATNPNDIFWTKSFLLTDDILDVFFMKDDQIKSDVFVIQDMFKIALTIYNVPILNYFRKRGLLDLLEEKDHRFLLKPNVSSPDLEISFFIVQRNPNQAKSRLITRMMKLIKTTESFDRLKDMIPQKTFSKNVYPYIF